MTERDYSDLDERFTPYYESGERVEVGLPEGWGMLVGYGCRTDGRKVRFYVGRSTGWKPVYLMLLKKNSMGGEALTKGMKYEYIRGLGVYRR